MKPTYSEAFIEQALVKLYSRGTRTLRAVADELNINYHTLKNWTKRESVSLRRASPTKEKRPEDWATEEQLRAVCEAHGLSGEALQAWCREQGLFAHHLTRWKAAFCADEKLTTSGTRELRTLKDEIATLKREVGRKDKALAEAAALLILQKKFRALWEDEVK